MANEPLANKGNFLHIYDFRVKPGTGDDFIAAFEAFDHSGENFMHESKAQIKDGVLCRDETDPDHFYLIAEWNDKAEHRQLRKRMVERLAPKFLQYIEGGKFVPIYADVVV
ncbi:MAG: hypothetical protein FJX61_05590 [Alphaproteobacteria bacterium]|nr:hypothetical protein [Alphaproteobacteria bacterium]